MCNFIFRGILILMRPVSFLRQKLIEQMRFEILLMKARILSLSRLLSSFSAIL